MNAYTDEELEVIRIEARAEERAKIVAWLRRHDCLHVVDATDALERGEHLK